MYLKFSVMNLMMMTNLKQKKKLPKMKLMPMSPLMTAVVVMKKMNQKSPGNGKRKKRNWC